MLNTYPQFNSLDDADDHVQFICKGPCLCVVHGALWDVRGGGFATPADESDVTAWKLARPDQASEAELPQAEPHMSGRGRQGPR